LVKPIEAYFMYNRDELRDQIETVSAAFKNSTEMEFKETVKELHKLVNYVEPKKPNRWQKILINDKLSAAISITCIAVSATFLACVFITPEEVSKKYRTSALSFVVVMLAPSYGWNKASDAVKKHLNIPLDD
jgi:hypothetical protein